MNKLFQKALRGLESREPLLLDIFSSISLKHLLSLVSSPDIIVCDFSVEEIEKIALHKPWGYSMIGLSVVDHHADDPRMRRKISSAPLAAEFVKFNAILPAATKVCINHTDCDSILSSLIVLGLLPPMEELLQAAVIADHTGEENVIADALQAFSSERDIRFSLRNLIALITDSSLEPKAAKLWQTRLADRRRAQELVRNGAFKTSDKIAYGFVGDSKVPGEFLPALLPEAWVIVSGSRVKGDLFKIHLKVRLGAGAPEGFTLHQLNLETTPLNIRGRWNAASNGRGGETDVSVEEAVQIIQNRMDLLSP